VPSTEYEEEEEDEEEEDFEQEQDLEAKHVHHHPSLPTKSSLKGGSARNSVNQKGVRADVIPSKSRRKEQELEVKLADARKQLEQQQRQLERLQDGQTRGQAHGNAYSRRKPSSRGASVHFNDGGEPGGDGSSIQEPIKDCPANGLIRFSELVSIGSVCSVNVV
jgi:hypothetical protein